MPDAAKLRALYERFEFKSWLRDVQDAGGAAEKSTDDPVAAMADKARRADTPSFTERDIPPADAPQPVPRNYEMVVDAEALARWIDMIECAELVCCDSETTSLEPMNARIVGLSLAR